MARRAGRRDRSRRTGSGNHWAGCEKKWAGLQDWIHRWSFMRRHDGLGSRGRCAGLGSMERCMRRFQEKQKRRQSCRGSRLGKRKIILIKHDMKDKNLING
ncbi:hypothetical protein EV1_034412 [Malus domestica]